MLATMIIAMVGLMLLAVPVAVAIGLAGVIGTAFFTNLPLIVVPQQAFIALDKFPLAAIPFFILAGNIMAAGGISSRLICRQLLGRVHTDHHEQILQFNSIS